MNKQIFFAFVLLLFLASCTNESLTEDEQKFEAFCNQNGGDWMRMSEMRDGLVVGPPCYGCMPDERNHLCSKEEYEAMI